MAPINAYYGAVINIAGNGHGYGNIVLYRSKDEGDFTDLEMLILSVVNKHLSTSFRNQFPNGIFSAALSKQATRISSTYHLTTRESELVQELCNGTMRNELAGKLFISENTIKKHLNSIFRKTGTHNIEELQKMLNPVFPKIGL